MDPDLELLEAIAQGKEAALNELMTRYKTPLHRFVYRYLLNANDASEVVQETFVRVWFKAHRYKPSARVSSWVYSIAANLCRDRARKSRRWRLLPIEQPLRANGQALSESIPGNEKTADTALAAKDELAQLRGYIEMLPHKLRTPFVLCVLEDHSQDEAAAILGISTKAVETRIYRARNILRKAFGRT